MTCRPRASSARRRPTAVAVAPPTPASISSNTSVSTVSASPRTPLSASITRESSPPEAMRASGRAGCDARRRVEELDALRAVGRPRVERQHGDGDLEARAAHREVADCRRPALRRTRGRRPHERPQARLPRLAAPVRSPAPPPRQTLMASSPASCTARASSASARAAKTSSSRGPYFFISPESAESRESTTSRATGSCSMRSRYARVSAETSSPSADYVLQPRRKLVECRIDSRDLREGGRRFGDAIQCAPIATEQLRGVSGGLSESLAMLERGQARLECGILVELRIDSADLIGDESEIVRVLCGLGESVRERVAQRRRRPGRPLERRGMRTARWRQARRHACRDSRRAWPPREAPGARAARGGRRAARRARPAHRPSPSRHRACSGCGRRR